tara:strand:- start:958 stop:1170 length:213 start_codon:yes stop_codon:yes gene_type:complete
MREKIKERMDVLQKMMENNIHLDDAQRVTRQIETVSKFWSVLSEEDRDYIQGCQYAIEEKYKWKLDVPKK